MVFVIVWCSWSCKKQWVFCGHAEVCWDPGAVFRALLELVYWFKHPKKSSSSLSKSFFFIKQLRTLDIRQDILDAYLWIQYCPEILWLNIQHFFLNMWQVTIQNNLDPVLSLICGSKLLISIRSSLFGENGLILYLICFLCREKNKPIKRSVIPIDQKQVKFQDKES